MRWRPVHPLAVLAGMLLAGCASAPDAGAPTAPAGDAWAAPPWPDIASAKIRPGSITNPVWAYGTVLPGPGGGCTLDFVFRSPDNRTLYIGTAAHCVGPVGTTMHLFGDPDATQAVAQALVVYNSFDAMGTTTDEYTSACGSQDEAEDTPNCWNDFALLELPDTARGLVHPAVLGFGGPTGIAEVPMAGDRVVAFGRAPSRMHRAVVGEAADTATGVVVDSATWYALVLFDHPASVFAQGDSGGPVMDDAGRALGLTNWAYLVGVGADGHSPATQGVMNLAAALEFAAQHGAPPVALCTWASFDPLVP